VEIFLTAAACAVFVRLIFLLFREDVRKCKTKLPGGGYRLAYSDKRTGARRPGVIYGRTLTDAARGLSGKPDMIFFNGRRVIPVELKSSAIGNADGPREGDLMQLAAYFRLAEAQFKKKSVHGRLVYSDAMFIVLNTRKLQRRLSRVLNEMNGMIIGGKIREPAGGPRQSFAKCRNCPCRGTVCNQQD